MNKKMLVNIGIVFVMFWLFFGLPIMFSVIFRFKTISFFAGMVIEFIICFIFLIWFVVQMNKKILEIKENAENTEQEN